jgi:hypothetical protein
LPRYYIKKITGHLDRLLKAQVPASSLTDAIFTKELHYFMPCFSSSFIFSPLPHSQLLISNKMSTRRQQEREAEKQTPQITPHSTDFP